MLTRRNFLGRTLAGVAGCAATGGRSLWPAGELAWPGPMGLALYTVREPITDDPRGTLNKIAAIGYREVEIAAFATEASLKSELHAVDLGTPSAYFAGPKTIEDWKKSVDVAKGYGVRYAVVGDNPRLDSEAWKRRADLFNQCGTYSLAAGIQFCYHAHFREFERIDDTTGYDILLTRCDPILLKMEMDIFWAIYAGVDPVKYFRLHAGRFPLMHIKDLSKGVAVNSHESPPENGPNPFAPVGQGRIDWPRIFAHVRQAGAQHIFVEQDRCNVSPLEAIKISFDYLRHLRLG
jgi:sugar phosphate isomerase/epimerase